MQWFKEYEEYSDELRQITEPNKKELIQNCDLSESSSKEVIRCGFEITKVPQNGNNQSSKDNEVNLLNTNVTMDVIQGTEISCKSDTGSFSVMNKQTDCNRILEDNTFYKDESVRKDKVHVESEINSSATSNECVTTYIAET